MRCRNGHDYLGYSCSQCAHEERKRTGEKKPLDVALESPEFQKALESPEFQKALESPEFQKALSQLDLYQHGRPKARLKRTILCTHCRMEFNTDYEYYKHDCPCGESYVTCICAKEKKNEND